MNLLDDNEDQLEIDETKNYLEELVGDDKKFKSPEDLAKGKYIADHYIKTLEGRLDAMREEYGKVRNENIAGPKLQDLLDQIEDAKRQLSSRENTNNSNENNRASYDPKDVESLVSSTYQKLKETDREDGNFALVKQRLEQVYGRDFKNTVKEQSTALGLSDDEVNQMARKNPSLFMKTFDLNLSQGPQGNNFQTPPRSDRRSDNFGARLPEKRNFAFYQKMREKDPQAWMDKKVAVQMDKDAQAMGKEFFA